MDTLLGFDFGPRKIGVAVGQTITGSASPLTTIRSHGERPDWARIEGLIREWQPKAAVVGLPFNMDDSETALAPRARRFARQLQGRFGLEVHLVDERLTSMEARRQLESARNPSLGRGPSRHASRAFGPPFVTLSHARRGSPSLEAIDAMAAKLILETWLCEQH